MTYTTRSQVASHPPPVSIALLLEREHGLVGIAEGEVQCLCWEVTDDVCCVATPERHDTLLPRSTAKALPDAIVLAVEAARLKHFIL